MFEKLRKIMKDSLTDDKARVMLPVPFLELLPKDIVESAVMGILIDHFAYAVMKSLEKK